MQLARNMRRRCHLCSLGVPDSKMTGCPDLLQHCATCCYQKLSAALDTQTSFIGDKNIVIIAVSHANRGDLIKRGNGTKVIPGYRS